MDTVMRELRVTRLQIAGIESGNPKSFYNENFFIDLLKRYARLLNFSEPAIVKMISPRHRGGDAARARSSNGSTGRLCRGRCTA